MNFSAHEVFIWQKYGIFQKFFKIFLGEDFDVCHAVQNTNVCGDVAMCDALIRTRTRPVFIEFFIFEYKKSESRVPRKALQHKGFREFDVFLDVREGKRPVIFHQEFT